LMVVVILEVAVVLEIIEFPPRLFVRWGKKEGYTGLTLSEAKYAEKTSRGSTTSANATTADFLLKLLLVRKEELLLDPDKKYLIGPPKKPEEH
jgi:hypothetical protein